jgi:hypothetical protein
MSSSTGFAGTARRKPRTEDGGVGASASPAMTESIEAQHATLGAIDPTES